MLRNFSAENECINRDFLVETPPRVTKTSNNWKWGREIGIFRGRENEIFPFGSKPN